MLGTEPTNSSIFGHLAGAWGEHPGPRPRRPCACSRVPPGDVWSARRAAGVQRFLGHPWLGSALRLLLCAKRRIADIINEPVARYPGVVAEQRLPIARDRRSLFPMFIGALNGQQPSRHLLLGNPQGFASEFGAGTDAAQQGGARLSFIGHKKDIMSHFFVVVMGQVGLAFRDQMS